MKTKTIHITAAKGPSECCLAVAQALEEMIRETKLFGIEYEVISRSPGHINGTLISAVINLKGDQIQSFLSSWQGSILWVCKSPYRIHHKRKNWFIGVNEIKNAALLPLKENDITYQTMRSSGPGGQHVNKTESAVRATHAPSGLFASCDSQRSQLMNKTEAVKRLKAKYAEWQLKKILSLEIPGEWENNNDLARGNPTRIYSGGNFKRLQ